LLPFFKKIKNIDGYVKRGVIYCFASALGIGYELIFVRPIRPTVLILWTGVIGIGFVVFLTLRQE